jgi:peptide/nickel transport system ATP-binding protein/oligopeptide transport system ATP-binding protein
VNAPSEAIAIGQAGATAPVLQVQGLTTRLFLKRAIVPVVEDVSFSLLPGETLGIVGESGCGKSMTALSIMRLLPRGVGRIVKGSISIEGIGDLTRLSDSDMRRVRGADISMIFQEPMTSLNPLFRIGFQITEAIRAHHDVSRAEARRQAIGMLEQVRIPMAAERYHSFPHQLSGGMRQRVMIAMALACRPKVMLADEPTTALDVTIQAQVLKLIDDLRREARTSVVLITLDLGVIAKMARRVLVMYAGVVVEDADVRALFANPLHPYTQGLMRSIPNVARATAQRRRLDPIKGTVPNLADLPRGCRFSDRCPMVHEPCRRWEPPLAAPVDMPGVDRKVRCWLHARPPH